MGKDGGSAPAPPAAPTPPPEREPTEEEAAMTQALTGIYAPMGEFASAVLPMQTEQLGITMPLQTEMATTLAPLRTEAEAGLIPARAGLETAQIGAAGELIQPRTALREAMLTGGTLPGGYTVGTPYETSPFVTQAIEQAGQRFQNLGLLRSGAAGLQTRLAAGRVGAEMEARRRQEQLGLLGLA